MTTQLTVDFKGTDYVPERDEKRLTGQLGRVYGVMSDERWRSPEGIKAAIFTKYRRSDRLDSVMRMMRHLKRDVPGCDVEKRHVEGGIFEYRLVRS
jgi:hypothetical protein